MAPFGGSRDHLPRENANTYVRDHADNPYWTKVDLFLIALLILIPILGITFGL